MQNPTRTLTIASIKMFVRNRQALFFTLFSPLLIMVILGLIGFDKPQSFDIGLVAQNPSAETKVFVDQIKNFSVFKVHEGTLDEELTQLKDGERTVVVSVPFDFITSTAPVSPKELQVYINESKQGEAQAVISILSQYLDRTTLGLVAAPTYFTVKQEIVDSQHLKYIDFLLPGLIAMSVMQMAVFSVAFVFVQLKEKGVLKRLMATPMLPRHFVTAQIITRLLVSLAQAAIFIAVGVLALHAHVLGSYWLVLLCVILGGLMFLGLGFSISGLSKTVESVPAIANLSVFPMLFLGGVFFSISNMPMWLQHIAKFLPLTFFSTALRSVMTKTATFGDIKWDLLGMAVWAVILIGAATFSFRFQEKE